MNLVKAIICSLFSLPLITNAAEVMHFIERPLLFNNEDSSLVHLTIRFPNNFTVIIEEQEHGKNSVSTLAKMRDSDGKILFSETIGSDQISKFPKDSKNVNLGKENLFYNLSPSDDYIIFAFDKFFIIIEQDGRLSKVPIPANPYNFSVDQQINKFQVLKDKDGKLIELRFEINKTETRIALKDILGKGDILAAAVAPPTSTSPPAAKVSGNRNRAKILITKGEQQGANLLIDGKTTAITKNRVLQHTLKGEGIEVYAVLVTEGEVLVVTEKGIVRKLDLDFSRLQTSQDTIDGKTEKLISLFPKLISNEGKTFAVLSLPYNVSEKKDLATGETFIMDVDSGELVKIAYSAMSLTGEAYQVNDGILSLNGIDRKIDLRNLRAEAKFFNPKIPAIMLDDKGKAYDPIVATEAIFRNITEDFRAGRKRAFMQGAETQDIFRNMVAILGQQENPNPILLGEGGTGKTGLVYSFLQQIAQGKIPSIPRTARVYEMQKNTIEQSTHYVGALDSRLKALEATASMVPVILFVDEIHNLRGSGTHEGNPHNDIVDQLKPALVDGIYHLIGTSNEEKFNPAFSGDDTLMRRFTLITKPPVPKEEVLRIIDSWTERFKFPKLSDEVKEFLYDHSNKYIAHGAQPSKATTLMDKAYSRKRNLHSSDEALTKQDIVEALIASGVSAKLFVASSTAQALDQLKKGWDEKMAGQEHAREAYLELEALRLGGFLNPDKPASLLVTGPKGAGKTRGAQTYAMATNRSFVKLNMADYSEGGVKEFEKRISQELFKDRFAVILFDEIEKAAPSIKNILLAILQDGKVKISAKSSASDRAGSSTQTLDFTQATIVCTTNAGEDYVLKHMQTGAKQTLGFGKENDKDSEKLTTKIQENVMMEEGLKQAAMDDGLSAFLLDRFTLIVPAFPPKRAAFRQAVDINLTQMLKDFEKAKGFAFELMNREAFLDFAVTAYFHENMSNRIIETILHKHFRRWIARAVALAADPKAQSQKQLEKRSPKQIVKKILIEFNPTSGESKVDVLTACDGILQ